MGNCYGCRVRSVAGFFADLIVHGLNPLSSSPRSLRLQMRVRFSRALRCIHDAGSGVVVTVALSRPGVPSGTGTGAVVMRAVIGTYHRCCTELIERNGGFVAKYMGDGILAYFGYPQAHEHDAERAVRAGLALVEASPKLATTAGSPLQVRVGIATGLVVVGDLIEAGAAQEQAVVGETPNLAAHLQALAEPGAVVIASSTRRLIGGLFEYRDLRTAALKGFTENVLASQVLGAGTAESRFEALHATTIPSSVA